MRKNLLSLMTMAESLTVKADMSKEIMPEGLTREKHILTAVHIMQAATLDTIKDIVQIKIIINRMKEGHIDHSQISRKKHSKKIMIMLNKKCMRNHAFFSFCVIL